jgi:poly-beta-1,6-N-acetyl-D-glucosamine synthase
MSEQYVIVTPAYNEAACIARTIESVLQQTILPIRWVIVDNGSTDATAAIIRDYARRCPFLQYFYQTRVKEETYFANSVGATMGGVQQVSALDYGFLAMLDADIVLPHDYYERILSHFRANPRLGVASGIYENLINGKRQKVLSDRRSTPKAIQVFRRECFAQIHGYVPLPYGGEDTCACIMARMYDWTVWSFPDLIAVHQRPTGVRNGRGMLRARFLQGLCEYGLHTHPVFMIAKSLRRCLFEPPVILGGILRLGGYVYGWLKPWPRRMPADVAEYARREQIDRMLHINRIPGKDEERTYAA